MLLRTTLLLLGLLLAGPTAARGVYQTPEDFLAEAFAGDPPPPAVVWLTGDTGKAVAEILQHKPGRLRIRYWARDARSAWILEEIGKEKPITAGFIVQDGRLEKMRVLVFRESRGDEIRLPFFTRQFEGARLTDANALDRTIDNITGATLSVRAMRKLGRVALLLDQAIRQ